MINTEYKKLYFEYKKIMDIGISISDNSINLECDVFTEQASWLYTKILAHNCSLYKLLPRSPFDIEYKNELWDLSSIAVLTRSIIDTYYMMYYIGVDETDLKNRNFRFLLLEFHSEKKRLDMLKLNDCALEKISDIIENVKSLENEILTNEIYCALSTNIKNKINDGNLSTLLTNTKLSKLRGINEKYYKLVFKHLSNYVHAFPFAINQLSLFRAGDDESLNEIELIIQYSLIYLSLGIKDYLKILPKESTFKLNNEEHKLIEIYSNMAIVQD